MATKRDVRSAIVTMLLSGHGLDVLQVATESLLMDAMKATPFDLKRVAELGRLGGEVLKLKTAEAE